MAKPSVHRLRKGRWKGWIGYFLSFLLGAFFALGGYTYLIQKKSPAPEAFSQKVFIADQIIYTQLYETGISKKDVLLKQISTKKEGDMAWEQSLLKVQILPSLPFHSVEGNFRKGLSILGKPFSIQSSYESNNLQLNIKVMDRVTHQLTFIHTVPSIVKTTPRPMIAIVIDDLGQDDHIAQELLQWDLPLTFSILPFTPHSKTLALEVNRRGKEAILHLPMEPHGYPKIKPGEGALLQEMNEESLLHQLSKDIEAIPHIKGVSNHMGSRLTEDPEKMRIILSELKRRGLFFLDSRTTSQTIGLKTAKSIGLRAMERNIFIDHSLNENDIKRQLEQLAQLSLSTGKAIGIGHPHPSTLKSIKEMIPKMKEKGIDIVPLSAVME